MSRLITTLMALLLVVATGTTALAQSISLGGRVGVGISELDIEDVESVDTRTGLIVGGFLGVSLGPLFNVRPEVQFAQKGAEFGEDTEQVTVKVNYLEVALPATVNIPVAGAPIQPRVYAGPSVGLELSCDVEEVSDGSTEESSCEDDGRETKSVDFGLVLGAGIDIPAGPGAITVDGRYNLGLTNVNDTQDPALEQETKNRSWQFLAGYAIRLGL